MKPGFWGCPYSELCGDCFECVAAHSLLDKLRSQFPSVNAV